MTRTLKRRHFLGLAVTAILSLVVVTARGADAAEWRIEGKEVTGSASVTGAAHVVSNLLVPTQKLQILCSEHTIEVGLILSKGLAVGKIALKNCKTWQNGKEVPGCKPGEPVIAGGLATPVLHNGLTYIHFTPEKAGSPFAVVTFGGLCALPKQNEIGGSAIAECLNPTNLNAGAEYCEEEAVTHLGQIAPTELFKSNVLFFGLNPIVFDGVAEVKLSGADSGKKVSAFG